MLPIRIVVVLVVVIGGLLVALGFIHWDTNRPGCLNGQGFYGDWVVTGAIGDLEWRQRAWGCPAAQQYNRKTFKPGINLTNLPAIN